MSFPVILYRNLSPDNQVDKEVVKIWELDGTLREGTSLLDPIITFEALNPGFHTNHVNYLYIPLLERYYYITNILSPYHSLWEIHCHVDVLMSYAEQIREQVAVVSRQERNYNLMLDDGFFMVYQNPKIQTKLFSVTDPFEHQEFVLVVAGS